MINRRHFLKRSLSTSIAFASLGNLAACGRPTTNMASSDLLTDPHGLLDLPQGFAYQVISTEGDEMNDGLITPGDFDGMAAFETSDGITLIRNHELHPAELEKSPFGPENDRLGEVDRNRLFDRGSNFAGLPGGTTSLVLDPQTLAVRQQFLSLGGTHNNCAGGPTPWGSWLTCEETTDRRGGGLQQDHGWVFEVPASARELVVATPLTALGRFRHEAVAIDPSTGIAYQTEDRRVESLITRLLPRTPGNLLEGGRLQAMAVRGHPGLDTTNWSIRTMEVGQRVDVDWIDMSAIDNPDDDLALRHIALGAAQFTRGEGMWFGNNEVYFACTDGGPVQKGQIFRYIPSPDEGHSGETNLPGQLELFYESPTPDILDKVDNLTVAPWGDIIFAEDGDDEQYIRGVTQGGRVYTIARNAFNENSEFSEFCGPCFSPDGSTLFINVQSAPSRTFAIRGPWAELAS